MKLTKSDRRAFVAAVMDDVPTVDYSEQAREMAIDYILSTYPENVRAVYEDKATRNYIALSHYFLPSPFGNQYLPKALAVTHTQLEKHEGIRDLAEKAKEQNERLRDLRQKLTSVIESCTTLKQARERLPEFVAYLPQNRGRSDISDLPAISNVVADFTRAGWPKGQGA